MLRSLSLLLVGLLLASQESTTTGYEGPVRALVVGSDVGDIAIRSGAPSVTVTERWTYARPTVTQTLRDGVLEVTARCPNLLPLNDCSVGLLITVPRDANVKVSVAAGDVVAEDLAGTQDLRSSAGGVTANRMGAGRIVARSSAGNVTVQDLIAPDAITATTSSGDVLVSVPPGTYAITARTSSGKARVEGLQQDASAPRKIDARTSSGDAVVRGA